MTYFVLVAIIGTLGNGVILFAYGNRWSSSKSTSVVYILVLACFDLWTCLIAVPTIAIMEYRDFDVPTLICRFYSFSKNLIIISSFIMSFVALDRFLNIALPHSRLLNPRRVKVRYHQLRLRRRKNEIIEIICCLKSLTAIFRHR